MNPFVAPSGINGTLSRTVVAGSKPADDPRIIAALEEYLTAIEVGQSPDRQAFLAGFPDVAEELERCLDGLEFVRAVAPHLDGADKSAPAFAIGRPGQAGGNAVLGDFRLVREIGRGGMGVVYEAEQISLNRTVALKVLPFTAALDPRHLQRFKNEAQAAAQLHHPHIVPVFAVGTERGVPYYAMQLIDGQSLAAVLEELRAPRGGESTKRDLPTQGGLAASSSPKSSLRGTKSAAFFRIVAELGAQAAEALDYAHQCGIVHRDIKPANLLLDQRGHLWITDFGLARFAGEGGPTRSGDVLGTLRYMSPEQAQARRGVVDHRSDVYSLGATLYELLTRLPVFEGDDAKAILCQTTFEEPVAPRSLEPSIPVELETIVMKTLEKDPARRYGTAQDLADDLRRFLADQPIQARRPTLRDRAVKWARRHPAALTTGGLVTAILVLSTTFFSLALWQEKQEVERQRNMARSTVDTMFTQVAEEWLAQQPHQNEVQRRLLHEALQFYKLLVKERPNDRSVAHETGTAWRRIGDIEHRLGNSGGALTSYDQSVSLLGSLTADADAKAEYRASLAETHAHRGYILHEIGRFTDCATAYRMAFALYERLVADDPAKVEYRNGLAGCCNSLGLALFHLGKVAEAEARYRHALPLLEKVVAEHPERPAYRHDLASNQNNLGHLLRDAGRLHEAEHCYRRALALWLELAQSHADRPAYRQGLGVAHNNLGILLGAAQRTAEAEQSYRQAIALRQKLSCDYPTVPTYRRDWAATLAGLGMLQRLTSRMAEGEQSCRQSLAMREALAREFPARPDYRLDLADSWEQLGQLLALTGRHEEGVAAQRKSHEFRGGR